MGICLRQPWWIGWKVLALALALAWITAGPARAGILAGDTNAMAGWHGFVSLSGSHPNHYLYATVDYAVYAPGTFDLSFPGSDPSNNNAYVYAYEFFNNTTSTSTEKVSAFSVGLHGGGPVANAGYLTPPVGPTGQTSDPPGAITSTAAVWYYSTANYVGPGQNSEVLIFTSPFAPEWDLTALSANYSVGAQTPGNGIVPVQGNGVPSPTPEPATMLLLAMAGGLFGLLGIVRRRFRG
jgi:hypothetical protein